MSTLESTDEAEVGQRRRFGWRFAVLIIVALFVAYVLSFPPMWVFLNYEQGVISDRFIIQVYSPLIRLAEASSLAAAAFDWWYHVWEPPLAQVIYWLDL